MKRLAVGLIGGILLGVVVYWVAANTQWVDTRIPMPLKGEALTNPFYAAQRFAEKLGARTAWDRVLTTPSPDAVIVLSDWHWSLSGGRRETLERWVEAGGRLVVDWNLAGEDGEFERWSGVDHDYKASTSDPAEAAANRCRTFKEQRRGQVSDADTPPYWLCGFDDESVLSTAEEPEWSLRDAMGVQAVRVRVGRGSVTVINASPFTYRDLFEGDHAPLLVAATELRSGDEVRFLSEESHPSVLALVWEHGAPVVVLTLALIALALWRGGIRFGPLAAPSARARRSLAEQIRGSGQFALRYGGGEVLHAACVRALEDAARQRVPGYARLSARERAGALAGITGFDWNALAAAIYHPGQRGSHELRGTIALIETARRRTLLERTRSTHGKS